MAEEQTRWQKLCDAHPPTSPAAGSKLGGEHWPFNGQAHSFGFQWQLMREGLGSQGRRGCPRTQGFQGLLTRFPDWTARPLRAPFQGAADTGWSARGSRQPRSVGFVLSSFPWQL